MKKSLFIPIALLTMGLGISNARAMTPTYPYDIKFSRGVTNTCYYISSSASPYTSAINTAANQWENMNNKINNTAVSSNYATHMDIYARTPSTDSNLGTNVNGYTTIWSSTGTQLYFTGTSNYFYAEIVLNIENSPDSITVSHEMGHAYGIAHSTNEYSIMYPTRSYRKVTTPQSVDNDTINYLYP